MFTLTFIAIAVIVAVVIYLDKVVTVESEATKIVDDIENKFKK